MCLNLIFFKIHFDVKKSLTTIRFRVIVFKYECSILFELKYVFKLFEGNCLYIYIKKRAADRRRTPDIGIGALYH